jgi:uncharacterized membrane protein required for colicin V production
LVEKIIKLIIPEFVNNLLGALFGVAKVAVSFSVVIFFIHSIDSKQAILTEKATEKSFTYKYVEPIIYQLRITNCELKETSFLPHPKTKQPQ